MNNAGGIIITTLIFIIPIFFIVKTKNMYHSSVLYIINWMLMCYGLLCAVAELIPDYNKWLTFYSITLN